MNIFCTPLVMDTVWCHPFIFCVRVITYFSFIEDVSGRERGDGKAEQIVVGWVQRLDLTR